MGGHTDNLGATFLLLFDCIQTCIKHFKSELKEEIDYSDICNR